jgi:hypothetical protein
VQADAARVVGAAFSSPRLKKDRLKDIESEGARVRVSAALATAISTTLLGHPATRRSHRLLSYNGGPTSRRANEIVLNRAASVLNETLPRRSPGAVAVPAASRAIDPLRLRPDAARLGPPEKPWRPGVGGGEGGDAAGTRAQYVLALARARFWKLVTAVNSS